MLPTRGVRTLRRAAEVGEWHIFRAAAMKHVRSRGRRARRAPSVRYENQVAAAIDRGISDLEAGRTRTTEEVFALLEQQRLARTRG
jgi:predicted transcriptional regulator